jgi:hypothetical protein
MAAADPRDARAASALVSGEWRLGRALAHTADRAAAAQAFRNSVRHAEAMVASFPDRTLGTGVLAEACWNIGLSYRDEWSSCERAVTWFTRARTLFRELNRKTVEVDRALAGCTPAR